MAVTIGVLRETAPGERRVALVPEVAKKYLGYLKSAQLPAWEVPNMLAKYYTTTQALEIARKK